MEDLCSPVAFLKWCPRSWNNWSTPKDSTATQTKWWLASKCFACRVTASNDISILEDMKVQMCLGMLHSRPILSLASRAPKKCHLGASCLSNIRQRILDEMGLGLPIGSGGGSRSVQRVEDGVPYSAYS